MDENIGERIKKRRNELGFTLKDLSEKSGVLPQLISDYENGRKEPGIKNIKALCKALKIYPNYLLCESTFDGKINTYGNALQFYFEALKISKFDELIIDRENDSVKIEIKDKILKRALIQIKDFLAMGGDIAETMKNFNVNILSSMEIRDNNDDLK